MDVQPTEARDDDDVVDSLKAGAEQIGIGYSSLRRLIKNGRGPKVTYLSERRIGIRRRHLRDWLDARAR